MLAWRPSGRCRVAPSPCRVMGPVFCAAGVAQRPESGIRVPRHVLPSATMRSRPLSCPALRKDGPGDGPSGEAYHVFGQTMPTIKWVRSLGVRSHSYLRGRGLVAPGRSCNGIKKGVGNLCPRRTRPCGLPERLAGWYTAALDVNNKDSASVSRRRPARILAQSAFSLFKTCAKGSKTVTAAPSDKRITDWLA
jgi:hypothetical protein